jgi:hypothetical protein
MMEHIRSSIQSAHFLAQNNGGEIANTIVQVSSQAFVNGMREALLIGSMTMLVAALSAWLILPDKGKGSEFIRQDTMTGE